MKHPYALDCPCARCTKERARRSAQADRPHRPYCDCPQCFRPRRRVRAQGTRRPTPGSQAWAETRADDLGDSPDR